MQEPAHARTWLLVAVLFAVLIALRLAGVEEWVRAILRASLKAAGEYSDRRKLQGPLVAAILLGAAAGALALTYFATRNFRGRRNLARLAAILASWVMLLLIAVRLTSFSAVDAVLFGPVKLNWVIDLGASLIVMLAAIYYVRLVRARP